ncbi:IclR family transcriptional regulator [Eubacteriales bacterium OttesenSCG-928-A19]|nr:IclR family transcriptional regulator [Eubacteriales bacterium OttesenSCG-928-A19]
MKGNAGAVSNQSAAKTLAVIEHLAARDNQPQRLQDIAGELSMSASTAFRFLQALAASGYVQQDPASSRYFLTTKICSVAHSVSSNIHLHDLALPIMKALAADWGESVCLAIEQDMTVVYVGVVQGPDQMLRTMQHIGNRAPMHCTGVGKLLLLNYTEDEIDTLIARKGLPALTGNTLTTREALIAELAAVRDRDCAYDNEECEIGARCIAVPARDYTKRVVAALSVTGPIFRMTDDRLRERMDSILAARDALSALLGYDAAR